MLKTNEIYNIDCLKGISQLDKGSVNTVVTSPPYNKGFFNKQKKTNQIWNGFEIKYDCYNDNLPIENYETWLVEVLNSLGEVLASDGSIFFNHKPIRHHNKVWHPYKIIEKTNLNLYQEIIWNRRNSPNIRNDILTPCTERIFWLCKGKPKVFRNSIDTEYRGEVWTVPPSKQTNHPAPFPHQIPFNCIKLTTDENDLVLDPFIGSGTTAVVAKQLNRNYIGFELSEFYCDAAKTRLEELEEDKHEPD